MIIAVVDNGNGSKIASMIPFTKLIKPKDFNKVKASAYILSDGPYSKVAQEANSKIIESTEVPILGIGIGYIYVGSMYDCKIKEVKKTKKRNVFRIMHNSPLLVDMRRVDAFQEYTHVLENVPEDLLLIAASPECKHEIIQDMVQPIFGIHMNPELGGDGKLILNNFLRFVEVFEKYHKKKQAE